MFHLEEFSFRPKGRKNSEMYLKTVFILNLHFFFFIFLKETQLSLIFTTEAVKYLFSKWWLNFM